MANLLPHLIDMPMGLGDHLHELRRRLLMPIAVFAVLFVAGFICQNQLKLVMVKPLEWAIDIVGAEDAAKVGLVAGTPKLLQAGSLSEPLLVAVDLSLMFALVLVVPVLLYQLWMFVAVGLKQKERRLGFLFIPGAVAFFYVGMVAGYFVGLPVFYAWMIQMHTIDPTESSALLKMSTYFDDFVAWTLCFGAILDIPWAVMVVIRTGFVSYEKLAGMRKIIIIANVVAAAIITPGGDVMMLLLTFVPMQLLFESGLLLGRFMRRRATGPADGGTKADEGDPL